MNAYMGWVASAEELTPGYKVFRRQSDFGAESPSEYFTFMETHPSSICMPAFMTYMPGASVDGFYHYPSSLHQGAGVVTFADGHVETHRWADARTRKRVSAGVLAHMDRSVRNADVRWLQDHATRPTAELLAAASAGE